MNEKARHLIAVVMEMIDGTLITMEEEPFHAPAPWLLENWWNALNAALAVSEVGDHLDNKTYSLEATDQTESEKRNEDVQTDEAFEV
jgi:hypothetical protein